MQKLETTLVAHAARFKLLDMTAEVREVLRKMASLILAEINRFDTGGKNTFTTLNGLMAAIDTPWSNLHGKGSYMLRQAEKIMPWLVEIRAITNKLDELDRRGELIANGAQSQRVVVSRLMENLATLEMDKDELAALLKWLKEREEAGAFGKSA
jgi:hypothetical protein